MKKFAIILVLALTASLVKAENPLALGLKFGYVNSKYTIQDIKNLSVGDKTYSFDDFKADTKNGFQLGAMARLKFGERFFLQPEAYYAMKRGSTSFNAFDAATGNEEEALSQELSLQNLDVPILLSFKLLDLKVAQINAFAGPMASFVMDKEVKIKSGDNDWEDWEPENTELKSAQWNAQFGIGVDILMLSLDVRYEMGLSSATKGMLETKTDFLTFSLAWRIFG